MNATRILFPALVLVAALVGLGGAASYAQGTPDGETPAEEEVCDLESGAAFGLCVAYCEAMDCHLPDEDHPNTFPNASETACLRVKNNYIKLTGEESLPCEEEPAPEQ